MPRAKKRRQVLALLEQADAADAEDQRTVYQVVKQLAPWKPRQRVLTKNKDGQLLSASQRHAALVAYSQDLFALGQQQPDRSGTAFHLVFTVEAVEQQQLRVVKVGKAVLNGTAPSAIWKLMADGFAPGPTAGITPGGDRPPSPVDGCMDCMAAKTRKTAGPAGSAATDRIDEPVCQGAGRTATQHAV